MKRWTHQSETKTIILCDTLPRTVVPGKNESSAFMELFITLGLSFWSTSCISYPQPQQGG